MDYSKLYGALVNKHFRFGDYRLGESTTSVGRAIVTHQARKVSEILDGEYNVDFPMYHTMVAAALKGKSVDTALDSKVFNGKFQSESVVGGDTDSVVGSTLVNIDGKTDTIENHFSSMQQDNTYQLSLLPNDVELLFANGMVDTPCIVDGGWDYKPIKLLYRHKTSKRLFKITTSSGKTVTVTEDHSIMVICADGTLQSRTPLDLQPGDEVVEMR